MQNRAMPGAIRPNVLQMIPYSAGKPISEVQREFGLERIIKLASNENPLGPSPKALQAIAASASELHIYPDGAAYDLKAAISNKYKVSPEQILFGNGSDELIQMLGLVLLGSPEDEVVMPDPSFIRYQSAAELAPCKLVKVPMKPDMSYDIEAIGNAITPNTRMVFLASPNNPTGTLLTKTQVDALLPKLGSALLVLDEAYYEFAMHEPDYPSSIHYLEKGVNIVGLRTFSKAFGLAGIRVGFGFAPTWVADAINRARAPFNVNSLAQVAGIAALNDDEHVASTIENNREGLEIVRNAMKLAGADCFPTAANFVLADFYRPTRPIFDRLLRQGVIIRPGDIFGLNTCLRVSIGTRDENETFALALAKSLD